MTAAIHFVSGLLAAGYAVAALFFLKFWRESRDRLFGFFSLGFLLLAAHRALLPVIEPVELLYTVRLLAFVLIAYAIVEKNRSPG